MAKSTPGLRKKGEIWHIDKTIAGKKLRESTGEKELEAAERYLAMRIFEIRKESVYGERRVQTFDEAAARFIEEYGYKRSIDRDIDTLKAVMPYIGKSTLQKIHSSTLDRFIRDRKAAGITAGTLNRDMAVIRRVLKLCASSGVMSKVDLGSILRHCCHPSRGRNENLVPFRLQSKTG